MEFNVFRDYCKAENSDDEETNRDIQSRLYSEIYYTQIGTKANVNSEISTTDSDNLCRDATDNKTFGSSVSPVKSNFTNNSKTICSSSNSGSSKSNEVESKPDVNTINLENTTEAVSMKIDNQSNLNASPISDKSIQLSKDQIVCCDADNVKNSKSCTSDIENTHVKTENKSHNEGESSEHEHVNHQDPPMCIANGNLQDSDNILNKYKFSKSFINNLYQEKYHNIVKRLQESVKNGEQTRVNVDEAHDQREESGACKTNRQQEELDRYKKAINEMEERTKYDTSSKTQKAHTLAQEISLLSDSDSEESILEVPIPPKPQPPVIQLQDSDEEDTDTSTDMDIDYSFIKTNKTYLPRAKETDARSDDTENNTSILADGINDVSSHGDIMLNCTVVQKGAKSITEIMKMTKCARSERPKSSNENMEHSNEHEIENSTVSSDLLDKTGKDDNTESQSPSEAVTDNIVYERDKSESLHNFAEDEMISNFNDDENIEETKTRMNDANVRKRHLEDKSEQPSTSSAVKETEYTETKRLKISPEANNDDDENYFFRPMSDELKAFYNGSRGQENFDVEEIQRKMPKDPRLWAILDEDLMPGLFKTTKFGQKRCTNCNQLGHMKHNCLEPEKNVLCYICGKNGHKETRCPQKMCLTCGKKQNTFRKTCESCSKLYCNTCKAVGHVATKCPDLWRRFHQTTTITEVNAPTNLSQVMKPANSLYCCNCTKRGHDSSTCKEYRWSPHFPTPAFVSNYNEPHITSANKGSDPDVIPLKKQKRSLIFSDEDLEGCRIVYAYGTFRTTRPIGEEVMRKMCNTKLTPSDVESFMQGKISPPFFSQFRKLVEFEVRVYYDLNKEPRIRIRSPVGYSHIILESFLFWLQLDDKDKILSFIMDIPRKLNALLPFLETKLNKLSTNLKDPNCIWNEIKNTEKSLEWKTSEADNTTTRALSAKLSGARFELLKVFHTKPNVSRPVAHLRKKINKHKKSKKYITTPSYLYIIINYNKIFLPRTFKNSEIQHFLAMYNKSEGKKQQNERKGPNTRSKCKKDPIKACKKSQKKHKCSENPYEKFIEQLRCSNMTRQAANRNKQTEASNRVEQQMKSRIIVSTPVEYISNDVRSENEDAVHNMGSNITEITDVIDVDSVQSPHDQNTTNDNVTNIVSTNVTSSEDSATKQSDDIRAVEISSLQEQSGTSDSSPSSAKKKKSKKGKKGNSSGTKESSIATIELPLQNKADQLITEALKFELPYMNKAVEEIRKRINDKSLKQEHIDTLQRLVNMENEHRKYVSAFCNYLQ